MDRFAAMRLFVRIVERRSFTAAAKVIAEMEARLGVRLLQRTTRVVRPTLDGELFHQRCLRLLDDIDDAEGGFRGVAPKGLLRVEVQGTLAALLAARVAGVLCALPTDSAGDERKRPLGGSGGRGHRLRAALWPAARQRTGRTPRGHARTPHHLRHA